MIDSVKIVDPNKHLEYVFDKCNSEYLLDDNGISISELKSNYNTYSVYGKVGKSMDEPQLNSGIEITLTGWIIDTTVTPLDIKKQRLVSFFNPLSKLDLIFKRLMIQGYPKTSVKFGSTRKDNNDLFCKYQVTIFCPFPGFRSLSPELKYLPINYTGTYRHDGSQAIYPDSNNVFKIDFEGNMPCAISLTFNENEDEQSTSWSTAGMRLQALEVNQKTRTYSLSKVKEQFSTRSITLSTKRFYTSEHNDELSPGWYSYSGTTLVSALSEIDLANPDFIKLYPGLNAFRITDLSGNSLSCYDLWLEYYPLYIYPKEVW